ncbi:class I SAM-dependent methyltransferase [Streptosporangium sp. CA-115845]|uniref:class I SAM-dependent methyltransferase n=1 Tax=Streptosporangium sp. CA-115845 TaxID=3240071 RepID=UPI003D8CEFCD
MEGIDRAPEVITAARALSEDIPNASYLEADILNAGLAGERYDFISCIASIRHLPFAEALRKLHNAPAPGGTLAILGCYRQTTPVDYLPDLVAIPANQVRNIMIRKRADTRAGGILPDRDSPAGTPAAPITDPQMTLAEVRQEAQTLLPGAVINSSMYRCTR